MHDITPCPELLYTIKSLCSGLNTGLVLVIRRGPRCCSPFPMTLVSVIQVTVSGLKVSTLPAVTALVGRVLQSLIVLVKKWYVYALE